MGKYLRTTIGWICAGLLLAAVGFGCSKRTAASQGDTAAPAAKGSAPAAAGAAPSGGTEYCDFKGGPDNAPVKVVAYYPGRHEDTLAAVKALLQAFPQQVSVEIVDWRTPAGLKRRDASGLTCAAVTINGRNAFDLEMGGKTSKVLFVRAIDGEWTAEDLTAAVKQELAKVGAR
jgi:hypothetical protein